MDTNNKQVKNIGRAEADSDFRKYKLWKNQDNPPILPPNPPILPPNPPSQKNNNFPSLNNALAAEKQLIEAFVCPSFIDSLLRTSSSKSYRIL